MIDSKVSKSNTHTIIVSISESHYVRMAKASESDAHTCLWLREGDPYESESKTIEMFIIKPFCNGAHLLARGSSATAIFDYSGSYIECLQRAMSELKAIVI